MTINITTVLRKPAGRDEILDIVMPVLARRPDLAAEIRVDPNPGRFGPRWASVGWSGAERLFGKPEAIAGAVWWELGRSNSAHQFERPPELPSPPRD